MLRAILFDFNGVIVDDEPVHFRAFRRLAEEAGAPALTEQEYEARLLGLDDRSAVTAMLGARPGAPELSELLERKAVLYREEMGEKVTLFPGVAELVPRLASELALVIVSGARRAEIEWVLSSSGLASHFRGVVSADEVTRGKPDPEGYRRGMNHLRASDAALADLAPGHCVAIEDAPRGIDAARAAGARTVGVAHSCAVEQLADADLAVATFTELTVDRLRAVASA